VIRMKRKVILFRAPLDAVVAEEELQDPGPRDVLFETILTLVSSGTEMTAYRGDFPSNSAWSRWVRYPFAPGYDNVGRVLSVGREVESISPGDLVFSWAGHSSHAVLPQNAVTKIPKGLDPRQAVFGTLGQTALNGVRLGEIGIGDSVVVIGVGPVGQLSLQFARLSGAYPLIAMDLSPERLEIASRHGADLTIEAAREDPREAVSEATKGRMADIVFEVTGNQKVIPESLRLLKRRGKLVLLGSPRGPVEVDFHDEVHALGLRIIGAHNSMHTPVETPYNQWTLSRDLELFFDLLRSGRVVVGDLVSHVYAWKDGPKAYEMLLETGGKSMCVLFDWKTAGG